MPQQVTSLALEFTGPTRIFLTAQASGDGSFGQPSWGVRPAVRAGDAVLFYVPGKGLAHAAHATSDASQATKSGRATAEFDPEEFYELLKPVTLEQLRGVPELADWSVIQSRPFTDLDRRQPDPLEGDVRAALVRLIEAQNPGFIDQVDPQPQVWFTAGNPEENSNLLSLQPGDVVWWAVPIDCRHGDYVFLWVNGEGFRYVLRAIGLSRPAQESEPGPHQSRHRVVARLAEPVTFAQLSQDEVLGKEWRLVKLKMNGPAVNQTSNLLEDTAVWPAFRELLIRHDLELRPLLEAIESRTTPTPQPNTLVSRYAGYSRDLPTGKVSDDLLDLQAEFRILGTILAAKAVAPPLAVGLFGDWGSGKSFFIKQVKREVDEISRLAREERAQNSDKIEFFENTVQIEFNAWHYSDGDLWASLVDHLFTSLREELRRRRGENQQKQADAELQNLLIELETTERAERAASHQIKALDRKIGEAEGRLNNARTRLAGEEKKLAKARHEDAWKGVGIEVVGAKLKQKLADTAGNHGYPGLAKDVHQLVALGRRVGAVGRRGEVVWRSLRREGLQQWKLGWLLAALLAAFAIGPLLGAIATEGKIPGADLLATLGQAVVLVGGVVSWAIPRARWLSDKLKGAEAFLDTVEAASQRVEARLRKNASAREQKLAKAEGEIAGLRVELELAQRARAEAEGHKTSLIAQMEERLPERRLADFIEERANSKDYREKLGVMALVRRDFERLSDLLLQQRDRSGTVAAARETIRRKQPGKPLPAIDRIILYIDDLDRCREEKVVEVLQAVHLLLAYELFIVVVAVDARWVTRSLELEHSQLLLRGGSPDHGREQADPGGFASDKLPQHAPPRTTASDYLEKIFQIPYWLPPFSRGASMRMVDGLLRPQLDSEAAGPGEAAAEPLPPIETLPGFEALSSRPPIELPAERSLTPEGLKISRDEFLTLVQVAPLAGETPRQVKRFTNLFRLVKVGLGERELERFLAELDPGYRPAAVLLAIVTGAPKATIELWQLIESGDAETTLEELTRRILWDGKAPPEDPFGPDQRQLVTRNPEVTVAARRLQAVASTMPDLRLEHLLPWIRPIRRYSFDGNPAS